MTPRDRAAPCQPSWRADTARPQAAWPELTDTQFHTDVINRQYDMAADFPLYPLNVVADLNAVLGFFYLHTNLFDVSLPTDPTTSPAYQGTHGDSSYYFFPTADLPLFAPLRQLGVPEALIDVVEPFFRVIVELGYDRSIPPGEPTPARLIPTLDPTTVTEDLVNAIGEEFNNAAALFGLPPLLSVPSPTPIAAAATEVARTDISPELTSTTTPTQTEQVTSTERATASYRMPTDTATRTDRRTQTEQLGLTEPATEQHVSTNTATSANVMTGTAEADGAPTGQTAASAPEPSAGASNSERAKPTLRPATTRHVVRDSLGSAEQPRDVPHRRQFPTAGEHVGTPCPSG